MQENVFRQLEKKAKEIEKTQSLESFAINSTNLDEGHRMRIEEDYSSVFKGMEQVYQDLKDLELADLLDFEKLVGRFDGECS